MNPIVIIINVLPREPITKMKATPMIIILFSDDRVWV